ncbi:HU family DNA-binding protein [Lactococcus taiwanensis]|uniref:HU family DNA-binding protein n=1 Tax=Lactococcus taiwanensis TaxID=1151742 RepID=UPI001906EE22|nr:HU family DNA-binding protein [Lactococcus taiwanensis]
MAAKQELINYIADRTELSKVTTAKAIDAFFEAITYYISEGTPVHLSNFGTFSVKRRAARVSHDIHSRERVLHEEQNVPVFRAGKALKMAAKKAQQHHMEVEEPFSQQLNINHQEPK